MAKTGIPDPIPGGNDSPGLPSRPFPGERPLGADEPSAPYEETPPDESLEPGIGVDGTGLDRSPEEPTAPGRRR